MQVVTANIKSNPLMRLERVIADYKKVASLGGIILWQEIAPKDYKAALVSTLPGYRSTNLDTEVPISFRRSLWEYVPLEQLPEGIMPSGVIETHPGRAHVTPARYLTYVILRRKAHTAHGVAVNHGPPVVFLNTHFVSGAWSNRHLLTRDLRRQLWQQHYDLMKALVLRFHDAGLTVIFGGDWNRMSIVKFHPDQRWLSLGSIDHLGCLEADGGAQVELRQMGVETAVNTDHDPRYAELFLTY